MHSIAICITYYNEKEFLTHCLDSLAIQTVLPDEVLIYDDCSIFPATDYIPKDFPLPIKIFRNIENKKPAFGRNLLIQEVTSTYIHFQDADDLFKPKFIEIVKNKINDDTYDIILNNIETLRDNKLLINANFTQKEILTSNSDLVEYCIKGAILPLMSTIKKELIKKHGGYLLAEILPQSEDYEFHIRLAFHAKKYCIIDEAIAIQRLRDNSHSGTNQKQVYTSGLTALNLLITELPSQYHEAIAQRATSIGTTLYRMGHKTEARTAWEFAKSISKNLFVNRNLLFQFICPIIGIENTEYLSLQYQKLKQKLSNKKN